MTLPDYYESLPNSISPKSEFVREISKRCEVTHQAIHRWIKKGLMPASKEHCDIISEVTKIPATILFPGYTEKFSQNGKH